jgi:hypothetical protein
MSEIAASPLNGRSIDRPFTSARRCCRPGGAYGTAWPVADVAAARRGDTHRTTVDAALPLARLELGHVLPAGTPVRAVRLDGRRVAARTARTARGLEVTVEVPRPRGEHRLEVVTG